jgi:CRISPR/Cas system endoribonuclease Cas6 (RAMP superfamily)
VLTGLLRVWNTVEGATRLEHTGEYYDWITENVYVSGHDLHTVRVSLGRKRNLVGFTGNIVYTIEASKDPLTKLTVGLAKFAEICNIGKNRSAGFGKTTVKIIGGNHRNE